jgi:hypothetical protein
MSICQRLTLAGRLGLNFQSCPEKGRDSLRLHSRSGLGGLRAPVSPPAAALFFPRLESFIRHSSPPEVSQGWGQAVGG